MTTYFLVFVYGGSPEIIPSDKAFLDWSERVSLFLEM